MLKKLYLLLLYSLLGTSNLSMFAMTEGDTDESSYTSSSETTIPKNPLSLKILALKAIAKLNTLTPTKYQIAPGAELIEETLEYQDLFKLELLLKEKATNASFYKPYYGSLLAKCLLNQQDAGVFDKQELFDLLFICTKHFLPFGAAVLLRHLIIGHQNDKPNSDDGPSTDDKPDENLIFTLRLIKLINTGHILKLEIDPSAREYFENQKKDLCDQIKSNTRDLAQMTSENGYNLRIPTFILATLLQADTNDLQMLLDMGASINEHDEQGCTALHYIFLNKNLSFKLFEWFKRKNADLNRCATGVHPMAKALASNNIAIAQELLTQIPCKDKPRLLKKALTYVIAFAPANHKEILFLLKNGAKANHHTFQSALSVFFDYPCPFFYILDSLESKQFNYYLLCRFILTEQLKADQNKQQVSFLDCFKKIVEQNKHLLEETDMKGLTLLVAACKICKSLLQVNASKLVDFILEQGCNVELQNELMMTPLMLACEKGQLPLVKVLLKYKANPLLRRSYNSESPHFNLPNALEIAEANRNISATFKEIYQLVLEAETKLSFLDKLFT